LTAIAENGYAGLVPQRKRFGHSSPDDWHLFAKATLFVVIIPIFWAVILPGVVAYRDNVFFASEVGRRLQSVAPEAWDEIKKYDDEQTGYWEANKKLSQRLHEWATRDEPTLDLKTIVDMKEQIQRQQRALRPKVFLFGFFNDDVTPILFLHFLFLGTLYLSAPRHPNSIKWSRTLVIASITYLLFDWPNYFRNFLFNKYLPNYPSHGRTVFASVQWDIDSTGFFLQEARIVSMFVAYAILWQLWFAHFEHIRDITKEWSVEPIVVTKFAERSSIATVEFGRWQVSSLLLAGAFMPWTYVYWESISSWGDLLYIFSAIAIHLAWGVSWLFLSLPLIRVWRQWVEFRFQALNSSLGKSAEDAERISRVFIDASPLSTDHS
jgi:hypothetical protein